MTTTGSTASSVVRNGEIKERQTATDMLETICRRLHELSGRYAQTTSRLCRFESNLIGARPSTASPANTDGVPSQTSVIGHIEEECTMLEINHRLFEETVSRLARNSE